MEPYPYGVTADVTMILKIYVNEREKLKPVRNRVLKKTNEMLMRCTQNWLTSMVPNGTNQDLGCGFVAFAQNTTKVMRTLQIFQPSSNLNPRSARSH